MSAMSSQQDELDQLRKRARRRLVGAIVMSLIAGGVMLRVLDSKPQHDMRPETVDIVSNLPGQPPSKPVAESPVPAGDAAQAPQHAISAPATQHPPGPVEAAPHAAPAAPAVVEVPAPAAAPPTPRLAAAMPTPVVESSVAVVKPAPAAPVRETPAKPEPKIEARPEPKPETRHEARVEVTKPEVKPEKPQDKPEEKKPRETHADPAAILSGKEPRAEAKADKPAEKKADDKPRDTGGKQRYVIQLAALSDPAKADALRQKLSGLGVAASVSRAETSKGEIHRVRVGPFASQDEAKAVMSKLNAAGVSGIMVPQ